MHKIHMIGEIEAVVFILQSYFTTHAALKIGEYRWDIQTHDVFRSIMS